MEAPYHCLIPEPMKLFMNPMRHRNCSSTCRCITGEEHGTYKKWLVCRP